MTLQQKVLVLACPRNDAALPLQLQHLVVSGELACSKEEAASLACIQLRIEETWAPPDPPSSAHTLPPASTHAHTHASTPAPTPTHALSPGPGHASLSATVPARDPTFSFGVANSHSTPTGLYGHAQTHAYAPSLAPPTTSSFLQSHAGYHGAFLAASHTHQNGKVSRWGFQMLSSLKDIPRSLLCFFEMHF